MEPGISALAAAVVPYVSAAVGAYGAGVLTRPEDAATDAVGIGARLLRRMLRNDESAPTVSAAVVDLADDPADEDRLAALRLQIRKALAADPSLVADVAGIVAAARAPVVVSGERAVGTQAITGDFNVFLGNVHSGYPGRGRP